MNEIKKVYILLGIIIIAIFLLIFKNHNDVTKDLFIGTTYSVDDIDKIEISHEKSTKIYENDKDIQLIIDSLKPVRLTHLQGNKDANGWIYALKVYMDNQVVDTILVHNNIVKYNQESYRSEKNIVLILDDILDQIMH